MIEYRYDLDSSTSLTINNRYLEYLDINLKIAHFWALHFKVSTFIWIDVVTAHHSLDWLLLVCWGEDCRGAPQARLVQGAAVVGGAGQVQEAARVPGLDTRHAPRALRGLGGHSGHHYSLGLVPQIH